MADFEDIKGKGLLSNRGEELLRARRERMETKSVQEVRVLERIAQDMAEIDKLTSTIQDNFEDKLQQITTLGARVQELRKTAARLERGREHGATKQFVTSARTSLGARATVEDISSVTRSSQTLGPSISMAQQMSTAELEAQAQRGRALLQRQQGRILETAQNIQEDPSQAAKFSLQMQTRERIIQDIGQAEAALRSQRKLGLDTQSQYYRASGVTERVERERERQQIREDVAAGRAGDKQQVQQQLNEVSKQLIDTFKRLDSAIKENRADAADLSREFKNLEGQYEKHQQTLQEMDRMGGGGGGLRDAAARFGMIGDLGVVGQAVGQGYRYNYVTSEMAQTQQRIGFAEMSNQRFFDAYQATQGDMSALRRVMQDTFGDQVRRGVEFGGREDVAQLLEVAGKGAQLTETVGKGFLDRIPGLGGGGIPGFGGAGGAAAEGAGAAGAGGIKGTFGSIGGKALGVAGFLAQAGPGVAAEASGDALQFNKLLTDYRKQITQSQTFLQSAQQLRQLQDTISAVDDFTAQRSMDYLTDLTKSTRGLGVGRVPEDFYQEVNLETAPLGGARGRAAAGMMTDIETTGEARKADRVGMIGDALNAVGRGEATDEQKKFIRGEVDPAAMERMRDLVAGKEERVQQRGFFGAAGDVLGFGPSDDELRDRGRAIRGQRLDEAVGKETDELSATMATKRNLRGLQGLAPDTKDMATRLLNLGEELGYKDLTISEGLRDSQRQAELYAQGRTAPGPIVTKAPAGSSKHEYGMAVDMFFGEGKTQKERFDPEKYTSLARAYQERYGAEDMRWGGDFKSFTDMPHFEVSRRRPSARPTPFETDVTGRDETQERIRGRGIRGGGDRQTLTELLADPAVVRMLSEEAGLSTKDIPKLTGMGIGLLGKEMRGQEGVDTLRRAGETARVGYFQSPEQYMQARGQLTGVGGGAEDLEKIMRNAVAAGMDSSKNIMEMVAATQQLATTSATAGIETVTGTTEMLGRGIQSLRGMGVSENMAVRAAQQGAQAAEQFATSDQLDIFNVMEFAELRKEFSGAKMFELEALQTASPQELQQVRDLYKKGDTGEARRTARQMGLEGVLTDEEATNKALGTTRRQVTRRQTGIGINLDLEKKYQQLSEEGVPFDQMPADVQNFVNARTRQTAGRGVAGAALTEAVNFSRTAAQGDLARAPGGGVVGGMEEKERGAAIADARVFADGVGKFEGGVQAFGIAVSQLSQAIAPEKFAEATKQAAENMTVATSQFSNQMAQFRTTVGQFTSDLSKLIDKMKGTGTKAGNLDGNVNPNQTRKGP